MRASQRLVLESRPGLIVRLRLQMRSRVVELGYARVSTVKQDLDRQIEALLEVGIARNRSTASNGHHGAARRAAIGRV